MQECLQDAEDDEEIAECLDELGLNAELSGGRWITTGGGNKVYIKGGEAVAGNPHVTGKMKGGGKDGKAEAKPGGKITAHDPLGIGHATTYGEAKPKGKAEAKPGGKAATEPKQAPSTAKGAKATAGAGG